MSLEVKRLVYYDYEEACDHLELVGIATEEKLGDIIDECCNEDWWSDTTNLVTINEDWWDKLDQDPEAQYLLDMIWDELDGDTHGEINLLIN